MSDSTGPPEPLKTERMVMYPREVAVATGRNLNELYGLFQRGAAPFPVHRLGRKWVIPRTPFLAWLNGETTQTERD